MSGIFAFRCNCCGEIHEGSPSIGFKVPDHFASLSEEEKRRKGRIDSDLCVITDEGHSDYFIRTALEVPIHGVSEPFTWGLWVSLSEESFTRYVETWEEPDERDVFFGWVCNQLPWYSKFDRLATDVRVQLNGKRPLLSLHTSDDNQHPLVVDQREGISVAKAQEIAEYFQHKK